MSINSNDLIDSLLDHQARVNFATDSGDINTLISDLWTLMPADPIGTAETLNVVTYIPPHKYDDGQTKYGFAKFS